MAAACLMLGRPELMLWRAGECSWCLKDSFGCIQTPWVITVLAAAQGHLALERGSIWLHGSSWVPCPARIRGLCLSRMLSSNPYLLLTLALWEHCSAQRWSLISASSDNCHTFPGQ